MNEKIQVGINSPPVTIQKKLSNLLSVVASQKIVAFSLLLVVSGGVVLVFPSPLINISLMLTVDSTAIVHVKLQHHT
jgi:hypothetical protein